MDFVNNVVIEGFVSTIAVSLQYLCEILDPLIIARHELLPLFEAGPKQRSVVICGSWIKQVSDDHWIPGKSECHSQLAKGDVGSPCTGLGRHVLAVGY